MAVLARRFVLGLFVLTAPPAWAQPAAGPIVSGVVGAMAIDSRTDFSFSVAAGFRFNRAFGLGIELTSTPSVSSDGTGFYRPSPLLGPEFRAPDGQVTIFTANLRLEVPTTSPRVVPYAVVGGGVANVKNSVDVIILTASPVFTPADLTLAPTIYPPPYRQPYVYSTTDLALTFGGGVSLLAGEHLSVDVDLRYLRVVGNRDRNIGRFGAGASYRF